MARHVRDKFVKQARYQNYRARSAFKLIEMDDKYKLLRPGLIVVECGAAPGSWTQVIVERLKLDPKNMHKTGAVISVDMSLFTPVPGAICLSQTDFTSPICQAKILSALDGRKVDLILSDMAPNVTGQHELDHDCIVKLIKSTFQFANTCLKNGGTFLFKIFNGSQTSKLVLELSQHFASVKRIKPDASRNDSTELYILAKDYKRLSK